MNEFVSQSSVTSIHARSLICVSVLAVLSACGSGGSGGDDTPNQAAANAPIVSLDVSAGDTSALADGVEDQVLRENAARNAAVALSANMPGVNSFSSVASSAVTVTEEQSGFLLNDALASSSNSTGGLLNDAIAGGFGGLQSDSLTLLADLIVAPDDELNDDSNRLLLATLGLDESGGATSMREGNRITIDPDDAAVCATNPFESLAADYESSMSLEQLECQEIVSQLTVQLDAVTEERGALTYLFNRQPLLVIGYGPRNVMYDLNLDVLHQVQLMSAQLTGDSDSVPAIMQGAIRLALSVNNETTGLESGTMALAISEPVLIEDGNDRMSLARSNVFTMEHDQAMGTASLELGMGALEFIVEDMDSLGNGTAELLTWAMGGLSGRFDLLANGERLKVSNFGLLNGPLTLALGGELDMQVSMPPLGFSLSETSGELSLDTALNVSASVVLRDPQGNATIDFGLEAPATTVIDTVTEIDSQTVKTGGPLQLNYSFAGGGSSVDGYVSWLPGACQSASSDADLLLFTCDDDFLD